MPHTDERDREARAAAHALYNDPRISPLARPPAQNGLHPAVSTVDQTPVGYQRKLSASRRVFCLLATFDVLLIAILWFIYIQLVGLGINKGFYCQIQKYNFRYSLFDIVAMAFFRMIVLLLAYALFVSKHWIFAAITTIATSGLLISKIFLFHFQGTDGYPPECAPENTSSVLMSIVIFICSLLIAWLELWVFDFKVIPSEKRMLQQLNEDAAHSVVVDERRRLLDPNMRRYDLPGGQAFYSPYDSPRDSDTESVNSEQSGTSFKSSRGDFQSLPNSQRGSTIDLAASIQEQEYIQKAKDSLVKLQDILENTTMWKELIKEENMTIYAGSYPGISQRLYKLETILQTSPETMVEIIWDKCHESASWNPALVDAERVQLINSFVDILYSVAAPGGKGLFSSRDFVSVRLCEQRGERYVSSAMAVEHPSKPPVPGYVRGEIGVSGWVLEPVPDKPGHCRYVWIINSDIKMKVWTPSSIIDPIIGEVVQGSYHGLISHLASLEDPVSS